MRTIAMKTNIQIIQYVICQVAWLGLLFAGITTVYAASKDAATSGVGMNLSNMGPLKPPAVRAGTTGAFIAYDPNNPTNTGMQIKSGALNAIQWQKVTGMTPVPLTMQAGWTAVAVKYSGYYYISLSLSMCTWGPADNGSAPSGSVYFGLEQWVATFDVNGNESDIRIFYSGDVPIELKAWSWAYGDWTCNARYSPYYIYGTVYLKAGSYIYPPRIWTTSIYSQDAGYGGGSPATVMYIGTTVNAADRVARGMTIYLLGAY